MFGADSSQYFAHLVNCTPLWLPYIYIFLRFPYFQTAFFVKFYSKGKKIKCEKGAQSRLLIKRICNVSSLDRGKKLV